MNREPGFLIAICIAAVIVAGCTGTSTSAVTSAPTTVPPSPVTPAVNHVIVTSTGCTGDVCSFVPAATVPAKATSLRIEASPSRYSPMMSSTPGIGLEPNATGFNASAADFEWNASFGQFLSWNAPGYTVGQQGAAASNHGEKLYWSFTDKPSSTTEPVVITVRARDPATGAVLGTSTVILAWDGTNAVTVRETR